MLVALNVAYICGFSVIVVTMSSANAKLAATANGDSWAYQLLGDLFYTCPLLRLGHELSIGEGNQVFGYVFDHRASFALVNDTTGSARFTDLDFVFGLPLDGSRAATAQEQDLSRRMIEMWSTFARTGYA
ncbi:hypothetical protein HPB50_005147 [Hyalomma asiaticum]|uniref:Uncharacterized protein n=1 Tax=Hyalomma asiaticum TaxID=266040 RepID=A0ACB7RMQ1_HYAAI|nr:hypothetical protein HPB50_005147 [Hyalomma asiaticum]